jgi:hypothetical protein
MAIQAPSRRTRTLTRVAAWARRARRPLALAAVLFAAFALGMSAYTDAFRVCRQQVLAVAGHLVTAEHCDPLSVADLAPLWVLALALLWPDIRSLSFFGVGFEKQLEQLASLIPWRSPAKGGPCLLGQLSATAIF